MTSDDTAKIREALSSQPWLDTGRLSLRKFGLRALPDLEEPPVGVRDLDLSGNRLVELPPWIWRLENLEHLDLSDNRLKRLAAGIGELAELHQLDISENAITALPEALSRCVGLRMLNVYGNRLERLSPVDRLVGLRLLDAAGNRLKELDCLPPNVISLDLSENQLDTLPTIIADLASLRRLDLSGNNLVSASWQLLAGLPLEELYLDDNGLQSLPAPGDVPVIRRMSALGNPTAGRLVDTGESPSGPRPIIANAYAAVAAGQAVQAVRRSVSGGALPGRQYFDAPTYSIGALKITGRDSRYLRKKPRLTPCQQPR